MGITGAVARRTIQITDADGYRVRVDAGVRRCTDVALMDHAPRKLAWNCQKERLVGTAFTRGGAARFLGTPQRIPTAVGFHGNTKSVPLLTPNARASSARKRPTLSDRLDSRGTKEKHE